MASIQKRTTADGDVSYRVQVRLKGHPSETASFARLADAKKWAQNTESAIREGRHFKTSQAKKHTMGEAIDRYFTEVLAHRDNPVNQTTYLNWWKQAIQGIKRFRWLNVTLTYQRRISKSPEKHVFSMVATVITVFFADIVVWY